MENKTVVHKGKVYEIGQEYLFFDDNTKLIYGRLKSICKSSSHPFANHHGDPFSSICAFSELKDHGTIKPVPVELINGNAYMFDIIGSFDLIGVFENSTHGMYRSHGKISLSLCTNIREMTVKEGD